MPDSLNREIKEFIWNRIESGYEEIIDEPEFKTLRRDILDLQQHISDSLPSGQKEVFNEYSELIGRRSSVMQEMVYKRGFTDGFEMKSNVRKSDG